MVMREVREERRNGLAGLIQKQWTGHVPLSVRYAAADAADAIVEAWFDQEPAFLASLDQRDALVDEMAARVDPESFLGPASGEAS